MSTYAHDTIVPVEGSDMGKKEQVAEMFDDIAHRYDFLNRFLSAGTDVRWRKKALNYLKSENPQNLLDVATGTADVAILAQKILNIKKITGIDISNGMLVLGREKVKKLGLQNNIELLEGDSENINYPDNSFDAATVAFGVRNFADLEKGLQEILRVLRPGGKLVILEFSKPKAPIIRQFYNLYMNHVSPAAGGLFSKNRGAYSYLNQSIKNFPEGKNFTQILQQSGYHDVAMKPLTFGVCTIYCGKK